MAICAISPNCYSTFYYVTYQTSYKEENGLHPQRVVKAWDNIDCVSSSVQKCVFLALALAMMIPSSPSSSFDFPVILPTMDLCHGRLLGSMLGAGTVVHAQYRRMHERVHRLPDALSGCVCQTLKNWHYSESVCRLHDSATVCYISAFPFINWLWLLTKRLLLKEPDVPDGLLHRTIWEGATRNCLEKGSRKCCGGHALTKHSITG